MEMQAKMFGEVFENVPLTDGIMRYLKDAVVSNIVLKTSQRRMSMNITLPCVVDEASIEALEKEIKGRFPYLNEVCVRFTYDMPEQSAAGKLGLYWQNIVKAIAARSLLCSKILNTAPWRYDEDGRLVISVMPNGSFLFQKKDIPRAIEEIVLERLGLHLRVVFVEDEKLQPKPQSKNTSDTALPPFVPAVQTAVANVKTEIPAEKGEKAGQDSRQKSGQNGEKKDERKSGQKNGQKNGQNEGFRGAASGGYAAKFPKKKGGRRDVRVVEDVTGIVTLLSEELETDEDIIVNGIIFGLDKRETKSGKWMFTLDMTDGTDSVTVKFFIEPEKFDESFKALIKKGSCVKVFGKVQFDEFTKEINIMAREFSPGTYRKAKRYDDYSGVKRVELHLHTQMSKMDAVTGAAEYVRRAKEWGHTAIAITDHGVVQAFPEAHSAAKKAGIKILYGTEAYLVDDLGAVVTLARDKTLNDDFVVFDIETTGIDKNICKIIEIGAVRVIGGEIADTFSAFVNPGTLLTGEITDLTGITDDMLAGADSIDKVLIDFFNFAGDSVVAAHNAQFDTGFINTAAKRLGLTFGNTRFCTLEASRTLLNNLPSHKLERVAKHLDVPLVNHHRALDDAMATAHIFIKLRAMFLERGIEKLSDVNLLAGEEMDKKKLKYYHAVIFAKDMTGLKNLYKLVSLSHLEYYSKRPRIPKSVYQKHREGLIIGTACEAGEFYKAVFDGAPDEMIENIAEFYDYLEIQPIGNNMYLYREGKAKSVEQLKDVNRAIVKFGELFNKPVVATCDVHFIDPEDEVFRRIIMAGEGFKDADQQAPLFYRTTEEMLAEFDYLGANKAYEVVVTNTNLIAGMCGEIKPIPDGTFPPEIPGADIELKEMTTKKAKDIYGDPLPKYVEDRLNRELGSIIKNGFSVMYIIAQKLVSDSVAHGYLVGSRGSVGSSFVATMADITEVNPLKPHYYCVKCKYSDFDSDEVNAYAGAAGYDMPDKYCPNCGEPLKKDGHDIPFETFLGFDGDKEPDIDLNFSGDYQAKAHAYTEELFGRGFVFKAGTIGTLADKTAYGYVKKYLDERGTVKRNAEINRLVGGLTGIKRTTGQHPGGLMVVPNTHSIYDFCPVQRPADDVNSDVITTHFDYHAMSGRLLKLDILGHDVPTIIRMLHDITGVDPREVDLGDSDVMSLFTTPEKLGVTKEEIMCNTGTLGLPEFGTSFVRQMLMDTRPSMFSDLVRISGLSHGTNVWLNNAQELVKNNIVTLREVIPTRDDIMVYLINAGIEKIKAFKIMETVRKKDSYLSEEQIKTLKDAKIPDWYIESCDKIEYLFPKGHAVAYVMMTVRIGYFKIHHPYAFYAASFSVKAEDFDYELMCKGIEAAKTELKRISALGKEATAKEKSTFTLLELVIEMYARGLKFAPLDLYESDAVKFRVVDTANGEALLPPLCAVQGLGANAAQSIVEARSEGEFISIQDFRERTKITKTVIDMLKSNRILGNMPETNQLSIFNLQISV